MKILGLFLMVSSMLPSADRTVVAISHRGEHLHHPENTLPAFQAAIDVGADFIEVDVRTTRDGKLVLVHNDTVDARTNGTGAIKDMSFEEIRKLDAGVKSGPQFRGTQVPTFEEALALARGKIGVYVDVKRASAQDVFAALKKYDMLDHCVIYARQQFLKEIQALHPTIRVMPEAVSVPVVQALIADLHPPVIAFSGFDWKDEIIAPAKAAHADIYVDRQGSTDTPEMWQDAIDRGATGIQTDKPAELVQYLRSKGYHK